MEFAHENLRGSGIFEGVWEIMGNSGKSEKSRGKKFKLII
jgi:hypothetical protein